MSWWRRLFAASEPEATRGASDASDAPSPCAVSSPTWDRALAGVDLEPLDPEVRGLVEACREGFSSQLVDRATTDVPAERRPAALAGLVEFLDRASESLASLEGQSDRRLELDALAAVCARAIPHLDGAAAAELVDAAVRSCRLAPAAALEHRLDDRAHRLPPPGTAELERSLRLAAALAETQPRHCLVQALERHGSNGQARDLLAAWLSEHVLRTGEDLSAEPTARAFHARLGDERHAFAALAPRLLDVERGAGIQPPRTRRSTARPASLLLLYDGAWRRDEQVGSDVALDDVPSPEPNDDDALAAVAAPLLRAWSTVLARRFAWPTGASTAAVAASIGAHEKRRGNARVQLVSSSEAWGALFLAGTRASAPSGARARLCVWRTLAVLLGLDADAAPERVEEHAAEGRFARVDVYDSIEDQWFDLGLAGFGQGCTGVRLLTALRRDR